MQRFILSSIAVFLFARFSSSAQTLVDSTSLAQEQVYKSLWGMDFINGKLYCGSDWSGEIFEIDESAKVLNTITTPLDVNHGLAFYNDQYIVAEDFSTSGALLYFTVLDGNFNGFSNYSRTGRVLYIGFIL